MDDNPWGAPSDSTASPSPVASPLPTPPLAPSTTTALSASAPAWEPSPKKPQSTTPEEEEEEEELDDTPQDQEAQQDELQDAIPLSPTLPPPVPHVEPESEETVEDEVVEEEHEESEPESERAPTPPTPLVDDDADEEHDAPSPVVTPSLPSTPPASTPAMLPPPTTSEEASGPPMDDFPSSDDEQEEQQAAPSNDDAPTIQVASGDGDDDFGDDDFDDFGEGGDGNGDDDDFGDFGEFDVGEEAFEAPAPPPAVLLPVAPAPVPSRAPSYSGHPPLRLDLSDTSRIAMAEQLKDFFEGAYPAASGSVSEEPERQVEGPGQVLVSEPLRGLLSTLSSLPPLRPLDWRRSRIRREHLIALGVPINLDDSSDAKPLAPLSLPSQLPPLSNPASRTSSPQRHVSSPISATSPAPFQPPSRSSTPFADRERMRAAATAPPLDRIRADNICSISPEDLILLSVKELKKLMEEIEAISAGASELLTHALLMREKEVSDAETYNGMIQDLVIAAAKTKTTTRGSVPPSRSSSGRWGRSVVK